MYKYIIRADGYMATAVHSEKNWFEMVDFIRESSKQAHAVSKDGAFMAFKWNDHDQKLENILRLMPDWEPLFGHLTKDGPGSKNIIISNKLFHLYEWKFS